MITTKLGGGLGNHMFQYAVIRALAEHNGYRFCYTPLRDARYYTKRLREYLRRLLGRKIDHPTKQTAQNDISYYFQLGGMGRFANALNCLIWAIIPNDKKSTYSQTNRELDNGMSYALFDESLFATKDWTEYVGSFQSEAYFRGARDKILEWYKLKPKFTRILDILEHALPTPAKQRCCIHVRRGDYLHMDKGLAWKRNGWALPIDYYKTAISQLPKDLHFVFVTDSPDYVTEAFDFIADKTLITGQFEAIDMMMFGRCRYNIIANSTFSWWGAWLNNISDKVVIAPKYHLGWAKQMWIPWEFERFPEDWQYIEVLDTVNTPRQNTDV